MVATGTTTNSDHIHGHNNHNDHNQYPAAPLPKKSLQIKQDDKFFSRLMSKETSMANSSCRVYYGEASGAVPFIWESQPGTPKHPFSDPSINDPPLTPPPSYASSTTTTTTSKSMKHKLFTAGTIFFSKKSTTTTTCTKSLNSWSVSSLSSSSSSSSSLNSSASYSNGGPCSGGRRQRRRRCYASGIPFDVYDYDEHESDGSPTSTLCFPVNGKERKWSGVNYSLGCYSIGNLKNAFLSIVGHGSSSSSAGNSTTTSSM